MTFASRITRLPRPFEPDRGAEAREAVPGLERPLAELLHGVGACSPYLGGLIHKEAGWLPGAFDDPEAALDAVCAGLRDVSATDLPDALRQAKRRVALMTALADLAGVWPLETVTGRLSEFAGRAVQLAFEATVGAEIRRGKLPGATEDDIPSAGGMVALAMGKMGAGELNYSSDIDLICLFDETRYDRDDFHDARASLIRATRKAMAMLSDLTGEGYVFRTDLRLRPDPSVTPVCMAMAAAEAYYESLGRTWERAAYIKAHPAAGDLAAGARFLATLKPFVWRRHLDFNAIRDAHDMRLRIREHKGLHGAITLPGHDMKLGRGGIREIEFFTQTRQLIAGGRDPDLRVRGTVPGLAKLAEKGWIPPDVAETLTRHYRAHREVEHRLQMVRDAQTHALPQSPEGMARIAAMMDTDVPALEADLRARLEEVHQLTEGFFAPDAPGTSGAAPAPEVPDGSEAVVERWRSYPALRSERAVEIFQRLRPEILGRLSRASDPHEALLSFDGFLSGLPAGVQLFSLFEANPQLIDLLLDITGTAPALARHLSRNAGVFDAVIGGSFFADWPGGEALAKELAARLAAERDYEARLDAARRWGKEWHFRVGVHLLRGLVTCAEAGQQYADIASATLRGLYPEVVAEVSRRHGPPPGRGAVVLGMGSLGAERLSATSDLDVIVIYDDAGQEESEGPKPLPARTYFARLTKALVTAMTAPMAEGRLYEVDMRLRPSGNQGPVATSWTAFKTYQQEEAWTWEHLALTRARVVAGSEALARDVERFRCALLSMGGAQEKVLHDVAEMRARIAAAKAPDGPWDTKIGPGHLQDIELIAQAGTLIAGAPSRCVVDGIEDLARLGFVDGAGRDALLAAHRLLWALQIAARLLSEKPLGPDALGEGARAFVTRVTEVETPEDLTDKLASCCAAAARVIDGILEEVAGDEASE
ncbi:glutamine-synthetase adenylyltransferase [Mesobacterium pallidum]|uniref:[protein-PII] uridylyltransferase family protein n=1 Tax=Mesobacterium pallidum TaxID=2872037 RepID=UPI001EE25A77|nr:glutamine-synthetase adenylyltransferase [Mesobacterium pallidum]